MPAQLLRLTTREEYHHFRRTRKSQSVDHPLQVLWEPVNLRIVYHWWKNGRRVRDPLLPAGHYTYKMLNCRQLSYGVLLYDAELVVLSITPRLH